MTVIINGTTGISGVDGSAGTPAVQGSDTNTGVFYPAADTVGVSTGGSERMRVDSSGNVGIGTASPTNFGAGITGLTINGTNGGGFVFKTNGSDTAYLYQTSSAFQIQNLQATPITLWTNNTERMRIDSSGNVGIGTTTPTSGYGVLQFAPGATGSFLSTTDAGLNLAQYNGEAYLIAYATLNAGGSWTARSTTSSSISARQGSSIVFTANSGLTSGSSFSPTEVGRFDSAGLFKFNSGYGSVATAYGCRAWVNFNGTGTVAIRASGNVSSITDNGTGQYTVNLTTSMPDANYCGVAMIRADTDYAPTVGQPHSFSTQTASALWLKTGSSSAALDSSVVTVAFFR